MAGEPAGVPDIERSRDRELARRCLAGDGAAQRELVRRFTALVWSLCIRAGLPETEADDVCQETFWRAFKALPRFRGEARLSTWLCTLALRRIADHRRSPARRDLPAGAASDPDFPQPKGPPPPSPESGAALSQRRQRVRTALAGLAEPARSVLVAYYLGEMPVGEIARTLGMPEGTVKTHLHRGRRALREGLRELC
ncbi:MAG TPA: sigma-70 family RNA polymerase sigma factor [Thermoanaerobaculia bacterium]|nr:sigma-70 family RNA polymerase sigma factor [Thermoanaerobaculia bacterium]